MEVIVLTEDNEKTAKAMSSKFDIDRVITQVLQNQNQKEETISRLETERDKVVGMVGDRINDVSAISRADLGIAIGSEKDVAKEYL